MIPPTLKGLNQTQWVTWQVPKPRRLLNSKTVVHNMLKWSEPDLTDFFGVAASHDDTPHSHSFEVRRDGLRLLVTIFDLEHIVFVSLFLDGLSEPLFTVCRERCTNAHVTEGTNFRRCFEAGTPEFKASNMGIPPLLAHGVRVFVEPQFQIELIEPRLGDA